MSPVIQDLKSLFKICTFPVNQRLIDQGYSQWRMLTHPADLQIVFLLPPAARLPRQPHAKTGKSLLFKISAALNEGKSQVPHTLLILPCFLQVYIIIISICRRTFFQYHYRAHSDDATLIYIRISIVTIFISISCTVNNRPLLFWK